MVVLHLCIAQITQCGHVPYEHYVEVIWNYQKAYIFQMIVHLTGEAQAAALKRHETNCQHRMETDEYNITGTKPDNDYFD